MASTAETAGRRGEPAADAKSVMAMRGAVITAAMIGAVCVAQMALAGPASAEPAVPTLADYEGRWTSDKLTLDISRCGEGLCGVMIVDGACGPTALRVNDQNLPQGAVFRSDRRELFGQLQLAANTQPYGVMLRLSRNDKVVLMIAGHTGGSLFADAPDVRLQCAARAQRRQHVPAEPEDLLRRRRYSPPPSPFASARSASGCGMVMTL